MTKEWAKEEQVVIPMRFERMASRLGILFGQVIRGYPWVVHVIKRLI
jgi:hypothetical protein